MAAAPDTARQLLRETFQNRPVEENIRGWDSLWKKSVTPWDRSGPSLAVLDAVTSHQNIFQGPLAANGNRKKALVPGCGRGYDVLQLAAMGYDTIGLDASESAIDAAKRYQAESRDETAYAAIDPQIGKGEATFIVQDFFKDGFLKETKTEKFDLIFDYTFLCALPPALRPAWAERMSQLLAEDGHLICLEWPLHKPPKEGGPPHGLSAQLYGELLRRPGLEVKYDEEGVVIAGEDSRKAVSEKALVQVKRFRPERTHEAGKESDYISIWRHSR